MEKITGIMDRRCILLDLSARDKERAVRELVQLLADAGKLADVEGCVSEVLERERVSSTGIGNGIAIPHRLIGGVSEMMMAVGRSGRGVPFESVDGKPAHLIFLIIGPRGRNNQYLRVLSTLSRHLNDRAFFEALMKADDADGVVGLVAERERCQ